VPAVRSTAVRIATEDPTGASAPSSRLRGKRLVTRSLALGPSSVCGGVRLVLRHVAWILLFTLPAVVLWWHVWSGHPSSMLTCGCGDAAQEVWFIAWPAWAVSHLANPFFSGAVNAPFGANLLSNTSGTLIGVVLTPITRLWGPIAATNVALTLAPGLSAWGCWVALRRFVTWKAGAVPAALVYGYSSAIVTGLTYGHVSVSLLVIPPLLFASLHEIVIRQEKTPLHDGLVLLALVVVQFLISPEILVMCAIFAVVGLAAVMMAGRRQRAGQARHAVQSIAIGLVPAALLLAYPAWYGVAGPQSVSGQLFVGAPTNGAHLSRIFSAGDYSAAGSALQRIGGYVGHHGPPINFLGLGVGACVAASVVIARRRPLVWLLVFLTLVCTWLSLGAVFLGGPSWLAHVWLPWRALSTLPMFNEIVPFQLSPLVPLFVAFLLGLGLDAAYLWAMGSTGWSRAKLQLVGSLVTVAVGLIAVVPVFMTFDVPLSVSVTGDPTWMSRDAPRLPDGTVLLTLPFAVTGVTFPMLWQAEDAMRFDLAGAALKTPNAQGGPVASGAPGSARRILSDLSLLGAPDPTGTPAQLAAVRKALRTWHVNEVVIDGQARDPGYASGFFTAVVGAAPTVVDGAWVWKVSPGGPSTPIISPAPLSSCRAVAGLSINRRPLAMARCVLAGGPLR
jgi:hypothetical protein